jgi:hypothetical protein
VVYILQMLNEGIMSGPAHISVFGFSPHAVKQVEGNCSQRFPSTCLVTFVQKLLSTQQVLAKWRVKSGERGVQVIDPTLPLLFSGNLRCKKTVTLHIVTLQKCADIACHWDSSSKICATNSFSMSSYVVAFTLLSVYEKAWTLFVWTKHRTRWDLDCSIHEGCCSIKSSGYVS